MAGFRRERFDLDITRVRYFLAFCDTLNFSTTARQLDISQPALTRALMRLEDELGGALVRREGKRTHLTPFGNAMVPQFRMLAEVNEQTEVAARDYLHGPDRSIEVAVMCTIGPRRISRFLAHYHSVHSNTRVVTFDVAHNQLIDRLLDGHADCALVGAEVNDEQRTNSMPLYREQLVLVHSKQHPFTSRESVTLDDVLEEPYLSLIHI